jgi:hypothetical protein
MTNIFRITLLTAVLLILPKANIHAQKVDEQRMERDIKVAEGVLGTLIKQQFETRRMFFPLDIKGSYQPGFGVTLRLPVDYTLPVSFAFSGDAPDVVWMDGNMHGNFAYSFTPPMPGRGGWDEEQIREAQKQANEAMKQAKVLEQQSRELSEQSRGLAERNDQLRGRARSGMRQGNTDSLRTIFNEKVITSAKDFLVDYGDMISQLAPDERIVITNRGEQPRAWVNQYYTSPKRSYLTIEMNKSDMLAHKQGKLSREQAMSKVKVVNTESVATAEPDLELLSSIFNRLYRPDIATTFFTDEGIYVERLKDYGAVYYMKVYSSNQSRNSELFNMPTAKLSDVDQAARDKKVKEMYPAFEKELKENILEYGRTVKSLADSELLVFNVRITRCTGCGIPSSLEVSVKGSVLKELSAGKISKEVAKGKMTIKKGANQ